MAHEIPQEKTVKELIDKHRAKVILVGTSHISKQSEEKIDDAISKHTPDIICLELDRQRFAALISGAKSNLSPKLIRHVGVVGYIFVVFASLVQGQLAKIVGTKPGLDMMYGYKKGVELQKKVALIDQPIQKTLHGLSKRFKKREILYMIWDTLKGMVGRSPLPIKNFDVKKVPPQKTIDNLVGFMKKRYPSLFQILVHERNIYMVEKLKHLQVKFPDQTIVAVIGAAHKKDMEHMLR